MGSQLKSLFLPVKKAAFVPLFLYTQKRMG